MPGFYSTGRAGASGARRSAPSESAAFLSGLGEFCRLLDARHLAQPLEPSAQAAVLMGLPYFGLPEAPREACSFAAVCGGTWGQGMEAVLELATSAAWWAQSHDIDPHDATLVELWQEAIGLAWVTELTARCHLMPAPYLAWEAAMLLTAVALHEQLRLLDSTNFNREVCLGTATIRQLESLVIQHEFDSSLSLASTLRKGSYLGPWPAVALGYRLAQNQASFGWSAGLLDAIESLHTTSVIQGCVRAEVRAQWSQWMDLARRSWLTGIATARRQSTRQ